MRRPLACILVLLSLSASAGAQRSAVPFGPADASMSASLEQVRDALASLRSLLVYYRVQHADRSPAADAMEDWAALLLTTTGDGRFTVNGMCGPYLAAPPLNALTGTSRIIAGGLASPPADAAWVYDPRTGALRAVIPPTAAAAAAGILHGDDYLVAPSGTVR